MPVKLLHGAAGKLCQIGIGRHGEEAAACGFGKVLQCFGIQLTDDMLPVSVLPEPVFALCIRNGTAGLRADADSNDQ